MTFFKRLQRLWKLSDEPRTSLTHEEVDEALVELFKKPLKPATVIQDDPLDIFPSDNPDQDDTTTS